MDTTEDQVEAKRGLETRRIADVESKKRKEDEVSEANGKQAENRIKRRTSFQ